MLTPSNDTTSTSAKGSGSDRGRSATGHSTGGLLAVRRSRSSRRSSSVSSVGSLSKLSGDSLANIFLSDVCRTNADRGTGPVVDALAVTGALDCGDDAVCVAYTDDCSTLVAGLFGGSIKVIRSSDGSLLRSLEAETATIPLSRLRCKPYRNWSDHKNTLLAATYASGHLRTWNFGTGKCLSEVRDEDQDAEYLCLSHNPFVDMVAVGMQNGHIKLFDEHTMQVVSLLQRSIRRHELDGHSSRVLCIANHPTNPHEFVSCGWDNYLQFWDARSPKAVRHMSGFIVCGEGLTFDKSGKELLVANWRAEHQLQILDYVSGKMVDDIDPQRRPHYLTAACFLDKDLIVTSATNKGRVAVVDRSKGITVASISDMPNVYGLAVADRVSNRSQQSAATFSLTSSSNVVTVQMHK